MPQLASSSLQHAMTHSDEYVQLSHVTEDFAQDVCPCLLSTSVMQDPHFAQLLLGCSEGAFTDFSAVPAGHQWPSDSLVLAASPSSVHHQQPLEFADVAVEANPNLMFERGQSLTLREQLLIPPLPTPVAPTIQHGAPALSSSVLLPPKTNRFQKEQLALCKLFEGEKRLQEAVHAATRRPAPKCIGKKKKEGNRLGIYKCQFCDYTSDRSYNTKQHEKTHNDPPHRPHKCIICKKGFVRKYDLKIHHQMHIREIRDMMKSCGLVLVQKHFPIFFRRL